jgi:hypothetical protein
LSWECWVLAVVVLVLFGHRYVPPHWWYISPTKRRAMKLAMRAARETHSAEIVWAYSGISRCDRKKCFVFLRHKSLWRPEPYSVFAVWFGNDQVDDLGTWVFHWGLFFASQPMDAYEECRAAGVAWPVGIGEWVKWSKERGKPVRSGNEDIEDT